MHSHCSVSLDGWNPMQLGPKPVSGDHLLWLSWPGRGQLIIENPHHSDKQKHCVKWQTMDSILVVVAWSMQCMGAGFWPSKNHLGEAFGPQERQRTRMANTSLGYRAFLVEVKGDWALLADVFRFPSCRSKDGCCWLCNVKPSTLHDFSLPQLLGARLRTDSAIGKSCPESWRRDSRCLHYSAAQG